MHRLPHLYNDPIYHLYVRYFLSADFLYKAYKNAFVELPQLDVGSPPAMQKMLEGLHFQKLWLAALYVVCDGYNCKIIQAPLSSWKEHCPELKESANSVSRNIRTLKKELRDFRDITNPNGK
jgi:hypothetical protein